MNNHDIDAFSSRRSTMYAPNGVVATSQPLAAEAGIQILREGGNAFDAAVSTAATLNVVEPTSTGLGGDVFALYRTAEGEVGAMRSCGGAPAEATIESVCEAIAERDGEEPDEIVMPAQGAHTVTVPGTARGWERTIENLGRLTLREVLSPAIEYAMGGYPVTEVIASHWRAGEELFTDPHAREAYLLDGASPRVGETMALPNLGESLRTIAEEGADVVYEGWIAEAIVDEVQDKGGLIDHEDLASFEPEFIDPVSTTYRGAEIYELPPNNQGLIVLEALNILSELDLKASASEIDRTHYAVEALKRAFHDGHHYITDPDHEEIPSLGSPDWARKRADGIGEQTGTVEIGVPGANAEDADTVLLTTADAEGNVVSYINSRFSGFGSGLVAGETGIALQNRGSSFSLHPEHPNSLQP
jgi:gamma-glutamyltranspeptidase/glutathione hydrolase